MEKKLYFKFPLRALIIGSVLSLITSVLCVYNMMVTISSFLAYDASTPVAIFFIFLLGLVNIILRKIKPSIAFSSFELLIIYSMLIISNILPTFGLFLRFIPGISGLFYFASSENKWDRVIFPHLKKWLFPEDLSGIKKFFEGISNGEKIPWSIWIKPLTIWSIYFFVFFIFILSILTILRKQWSERENLSYPLIQLPLSIIEDERGSLYRNRLFILGFLIPFTIGTIKAFHHYFPVIPDINIMQSFPIFRRTTEIHLRISFTTIGLTYFISQDLAFSIWFFYLLLTLEQGIFNLTGVYLYQPVPFSEGRDVVVFQCAGAFISYVIVSLWISRGWLKEVLTKVREGERGEEIFSYRAALLGIISCWVLLSLFLKITGFSFWISLLFLILVTISIIGISKGISEGGLLTGGAHSPLNIPVTTSLVGTKNLTPSSIIGIGMSIFHLGITKTSISINSMKMGEKYKLGEKRILVFSFFLSLLFCIIGSCWMTLYLAYKYGGLNAHSWLFVSSPSGVWNYVAQSIQYPTSLNKQAIGFMSIGGVLYFIFSFMRYKFLWWPLNPLGFAFSGTYFIITVWFSLFIGWLLKAIILKYAGINAYKKSKNFFLGLIMGQLFCVCFWFLIDILTKTRGNEPFWW